MRRLLIIPALALALFPIACGSSSGPNPSEAHCWSIPPQYGGGTYCSDEEAGGNHGYVNPGSMEWEVE